MNIGHPWAKHVQQVCGQNPCLVLLRGIMRLYPWHERTSQQSIILWTCKQSINISLKNRSLAEKCWTVSFMLMAVCTNDHRHLFFCYTCLSLKVDDDIAPINNQRQMSGDINIIFIWHSLPNILALVTTDWKWRRLIVRLQCVSGFVIHRFLGVKIYVLWKKENNFFCNNTIWDEDQ